MEELTEDLVSFEVAKLAKEKGFDIPIIKPTQALLAKWLLIKHNIKVNVDSSTKNLKGNWLDWYGYVNNKEIIDYRDGKDTPKEAMDIVLLEALKLLPNKE